MTMRTLPTTSAPAPPRPRTGAFGDVRARWLVVWAIVGGIAVALAADAVASVFDADVSEDLFGILTYLIIVAWVLVMVAGRARVDLRAMFTWPRLGARWWLVAGLLVAQFVFSIAAATVTSYLFPTLDDSLEGVGEGNLLVVFLSLAVLPPLVEETLFRGVLLERWTVRWNLAVGIGLSAVFFATLHVDPVGAGMFALVTSLLYLATGSLWPGILIHFVNNFVVVVATRWAPETDAPAMTASEAASTAAVGFALSLPLLVWFIWRYWPVRGTPTPYQAHEAVTGLPSRTFAPVAWSAVPGPLQLTATPTQLRISAAADPSHTIAVLPLERILGVYPSTQLMGHQVIVRLTDGTWTALQVNAGAQRANERLSRTIEDRARQAPQHRPLAR